MTALSVADIIDAWRECADLSQSQIDRLIGAGASVEALERRSRRLRICPRN